MKWESLGDAPGSGEVTRRTPVPGGHLYAVVHVGEPDEWDSYEETTRALTFVPDVVYCPHGHTGACMYCLRDAVRDGVGMVPR